MAKLPNYYKVSVDGLTVKLDPIYEEMVEVVRCKDCKYYKPQYQGVHRNCKTPYCMRCATVKVLPDDFCSYGERREGE